MLLKVPSPLSSTPGNPDIFKKLGFRKLELGWKVSCKQLAALG